MKKRVFGKLLVSAIVVLLASVGLITYALYSDANGSSNTEPIVVSSLGLPLAIDTVELPEPAEEIASSANMAKQAPAAASQTPETIEPVANPADDKDAQCAAIEAEFRENISNVVETVHYWQKMVYENGKDVLPKDNNGKLMEFYTSFSMLPGYYSNLAADKRQALGCYQ